MILLATTAITVSWPTLAAIAAIGVAAVRFGDRLWGRVRNGRPQVPTTETRLTKMEEHAGYVGRELREIKTELRTMNDRLFQILEKRG